MKRHTEFLFHIYDMERPDSYYERVCKWLLEVADPFSPESLDPLPSSAPTSSWNLYRELAKKGESSGSSGSIERNIGSENNGYEAYDYRRRRCSLSVHSLESRHSDSKRLSRPPPPPPPPAPPPRAPGRQEKEPECRDYVPPYMAMNNITPNTAGPYGPFPPPPVPPRHPKRLARADTSRPIPVSAGEHDAASFGRSIVSSLFGRRRSGADSNIETDLRRKHKDDKRREEERKMKQRKKESNKLKRRSAGSKDRRL